MAKRAPTPGNAAAGAGSSAVSIIAGMLIVTGLGVGAGGLFGLQFAARIEAGGSAHGSSARAAAPAKAGTAASPSLKLLPPVVTNLAAPERTWVRLEAAIVTEGEQSDVMAAQITEDIVAYLRTVALQHIQGASGFQYLREDLSERMRVRSGGKVRDLVIQSLIVE
jgi:flagellar protein FliL